jgi:hypothetical protein
MNVHIKSLLTVCGIASRNGSLPLVKAGKSQRDELLSQSLYPFNPTSYPFDLPRLGQKTVIMLCLHAFSLRQNRASTILRQFNPHNATASASV